MDAIRAKRSVFPAAKRLAQPYNSTSQKVLGHPTQDGKKSYINMQYTTFSPIVSSKSKQMFSFGKSS